MRYTRRILPPGLACILFTGTAFIGTAGRPALAQEAKTQEEIRKEIEKELETAGKTFAEKISQRIASLERALKEKDREISELRKKVDELAGAKPKAEQKPADKPAEKPAAKSPALLGIAHQAPSEEARAKLNLKEGKGAQVSEVHRESPAAKAGIQVGDIIVSLGGKDVGTADLGDVVRGRAPGDKLEVVILRGAEKITKTVELADREKFLASTSSEPAKKPEPAPAPKADPVVLGLLVEETDAGLAVQNVETGKTGAAAQLKEGDIILSLNGKKVKKLEDLTEARDKAKIGEEIAIEYKRKDGVVRATVIAAGEKGEPKFLKIDKVEEPKVAEPAKKPDAAKGSASLGVVVSEDSDGLRILEVKTGGAAAAAGIAKEDLIKEVAGKKPKTIDELKDLLSKQSPGEVISVTVARGSEQKVFEKVKLGGAGEAVASAPEPKKPEEPKKAEEPKKLEDAKPAPAKKPKGVLGITAQETDDLKLVVSTVKEKGPADKAGLKKDDLILKVNGVEIRRGFDDLEKVLGNVAAGEVVHFVVKRGDETKEIDVQLGAPETGAELEETGAAPRSAGTTLARGNPR